VRGPVCVQAVAKILLQYGAVVDIELGASKNKLTPLMIACSVGGLEFVRLLVSHGANPLHRGCQSALAGIYWCVGRVCLLLVRSTQMEPGVL